MAILNWRFDANALRGDLFGGLTAAIVALPLALAFGVASGLGPEAGLYGAIVTGFVAAVFGGTPSQITGPTGPMTVLMAGVVLSHAGQPAEVAAVVLMAGALQIGFGALRLGRFVTYMPYKVISGFMTGIGLLIILLQVAPLTGASEDPRGAAMVLARLPAMLGAAAPGALAIGGLTLAVVLFWPQRLRRVLPAPLAALLAGTLAAVIAVPEAATVGAIPQSLPGLVVPQLDLARLPAMLQSALALALLGSIDSLLTSLVADNLTNSHHHSDRELVGQGLGNMAAGLVGGIPGAGATVRTVVNVNAGGRTPVSGMIHAVTLLSLMLGLAPLVAHVPLAALAGILLKVGWDIIDWDYLRRMRRAPRQAMAVMVTVLLLTVFVDLITAVAAGLIMTSLLSAHALSEEQLRQLHLVSSEDTAGHLGEAERSLLRQAGGRVLLLHMLGPFSFGSATALVRRLSATASGHRVLVLDFTDVTLIDASIAMAVHQMIARAQGSGQAVHVVLPEGDRLRILDRMDALESLPRGHRHDHRVAALTAACQHLDSASPDPG